MKIYLIRSSGYEDMSNKVKKKAPPKKKKKSCSGVTRPTLKIPPTLEVFFLSFFRNCHKKS